ncbi:MAG: ABC transporter ATP-binding protein [Synergistaceae bacterium]|jgi:iron complex transport system ATP-binding protein|nr:ABC transporter ATP-binding protein [Synergistaceae bacterium]
MPAKTRLSVHSLSVALGGREILKPGAISFSIDSGNIVGLLGPNGSGKTTLIRALSGLVKKSSGAVEYRGAELSAAAPKDLAKIFAHVSQGEKFSSPYTVLESVVMGRYPHLGAFATYSEEDYETARNSLVRVSLSGFEERIVTELSGGESARVSIARALTQDTPVLLLDEPTAALDPKHAIAIMRLAKELAVEGRIILAAIHDISLAMASADRLIFLKEGEIVADIGADNLDETILNDVYDIPWEICEVGSGNRRVALPAAPVFPNGN